MSVEWIKELCPEIHDWQAEMIAEHHRKEKNHEKLMGK